MRLLFGLLLLGFSTESFTQATTATPTGPLNLAREAHTATLLNNGLVLVTGGITIDGNVTPTNTAEVFNPQTGIWRYTGIGQQTYMHFARGYHTATKLADGRVLIVGGETGPSQHSNTVELFDPTTETFTALGSMNDTHSAHSAVLLNDGRVLVVGGYQNNQNGGRAIAEIWTPTTDQWSISITNLTHAQYNAAARLLDGRVLVTGGGEINPKQVDLFDPVANTWQQLAPLLYDRAGHTMTTLPNGNVLVAGGNNLDTNYSSYTAEIYDPIANGGSGGTTLVVGSLTIGGTRHSAALLPNGNVLLAGGHDASPCGAIATSNAQLFNFASGTFSRETSLITSRTGFSMTALPSGQVLSAGGNNQQCTVSNILSDAELWMGSVSTGTLGTGTIHVDSIPEGGGFDIAGPTSVSGVTPATFPAMPAGLYHITYKSFPTSGYSTPLPQTATLLTGQVLSFKGFYTTLAPLTVTVPPCTNGICVAFKSAHNQTDLTKAVGTITITNQTGAWYEVSVNFNQTRLSFGNQLPTFLLAPYGSFVTDPASPVQFDPGDHLQLVVNKDSLDAMTMFLLDLTVRVFTGQSFPTSNEGLLDLGLGSLSTLVGNIETACAGDIGSELIAVKQHDTLGMVGSAATFAACVAKKPLARTAMTNLFKLVYKDATGALAAKWLKAASGAIGLVFNILSNGPSTIGFLGSEYLAADITLLNLVSSR